MTVIKLSRIVSYYYKHLFMGCFFMYYINVDIFSTGFSTMQLNQDQLDNIIDQFSEIIVDGMDTKTLCQYVYDDLVDYYSGISQHELQEFIENHDEDLWKELVDNETTVTYGLKEGESLSFPVHGT